jgi:homoserine dehydrogenase
MTTAHATRPETDALTVAIAGLGTVGAGVARMLAGNAGLIAARAGRPVRLVAVSARDRSRDRGLDLAGIDWLDDPAGLAGRAEVVVEAMGGADGAALATIEAAIAGGRHVVTANKALMAAHGARLAAAAEAQGRSLRFEAAVAGGIPVIKALTEGLAGNRITRVMGVMNGTCNYILTKMAATGADYAAVLAEAQALGYAEADPSFDVDGVDAAQKLALLAATAFGQRPDMAGMTIEGISRVSLTDIAHARDMGFRIKLLGVARDTGAGADAGEGGGIEARMQPCLVPEGSALGQLEGVTNMVVIEGDFIGRTVYSGPGAGAGPTASAIVGDIIDIARGLAMPSFGVPAALLAPPRRAARTAEAAYYLRVMLRDRPGVLAKVAFALGAHGVSIDRMRQYGHTDPVAPVLIVTHRCDRAAVDAALAEIAALDDCAAEPIALRIEDV